MIQRQEALSQRGVLVRSMSTAVNRRRAGAAGLPDVWSTPLVGGSIVALDELEEAALDRRGRLLRQLKERRWGP